MSLFFLTPGYMWGPAFAVQAGKGFRPAMIPTTVGVITLEDGSVVLVDVGFAQSEMQDMGTLLGPFRKRFFKIEGTAADSTVNQLRMRGIDPCDVKAIVATHLHLDHVGGYVDFPNAELIATSAEYASAWSYGSLVGFDHIRPILKSGRARQVELKKKGLSGFPSHIDLFGDGRVVLLDARGHTAGSVAVLLTDPDSGKSVLMAGDAAFSPAEYRLGRKCWLTALLGHRDDWIRTTWSRLAAFECDHPDTPVVLSHDLDCFNHLAHR